MGRFADNAADLNDRRQFRAIRHRNIVTAEFPGAPAGDVEPLVIQRKIDVGDSAAERL